MGFSAWRWLMRHPSDARQAGGRTCSGPAVACRLLRRDDRIAIMCESDERRPSHDPDQQPLLRRDGAADERRRRRRAGVRREFDTLFRTQAERILRDLDVVQREEFEAVKEMARLAREENEALKARIAALEAQGRARPGRSGPSPAADSRRAGAAFLPFAAPAAITRANRGPRHPWRLAAFAGGRKPPFSIDLDEDLHHGDRPCK